MKMQKRAAIVIAFASLFSLGCLCCGGAGNQQKANQQAQQQDPVDKPLEKNTQDLTSDLAELGRWCQRSLGEIEAANKSNMIRGEELRVAHLQQLKDSLLGKQIRWRLKVTHISELGLGVGPLRGPGFTIAVGRPYPGTGGYSDSPCGFFADVSRQKLRELSINDSVMVVGTVKKVDSGYRIEIADGKVEGAGKRADDPPSVPVILSKPLIPNKNGKPLVLSEMFNRLVVQKAEMEKAKIEGIHVDYVRNEHIREKVGWNGHLIRGEGTVTEVALNPNFRRAHIRLVVDSPVIEPDKKLKGESGKKQEIQTWVTTPYHPGDLKWGDIVEFQGILEDQHGRSRIYVNDCTFVRKK
jgi:hypothetical protein